MNELGEENTKRVIEKNKTYRIQEKNKTYLYYVTDMQGDIVTLTNQDTGEQKQVSKKRFQWELDTGKIYVAALLKALASLVANKKY